MAEPEAASAIMMDHLVKLTYVEDLPPNTVRFAEGLVDGRIIGEKCPVCARVIVPPKGYCSLDMVLMDSSHELEVSDHGTVTGFTIVAPVKYYGQTKTEPFVYASVLLDGASGTLGGQEIKGLPADKVRDGMRVKAIWKAPAERTTDGQSARGWGSVSGAIDGFESSGEPDVPKDHYKDHII